MPSSKIPATILSLDEIESTGKVRATRALPGVGEAEQGDLDEPCLSLGAFLVCVFAMSELKAFDACR